MLWILAALYTAPAQAQHPFYERLLEDGRLEMNAGNLDRAEQFLEIAGFGLLDQTDQLREIYIRLIIIQRRLQRQDRAAAFELRLNRLDASDSKPKDLPTNLWQEFRQAKSASQPPPNQQGAARQDDHSAQPPTDEPVDPTPPDALARVQRLQDAGRLQAARELVAREVAADPTDVALLSLALALTAPQEGSPQAVQYAGRLLALTEHHPLAHEVLGNEAARQARFVEANQHYAQVDRHVLPQTAALRSATNDALTATKTTDSTAAKAPLDNDTTSQNTNAVERVATESHLDRDPVATRSVGDSHQAALQHIHDLLDRGKLRRANREIKRLPTDLRSSEAYRHAYVKLHFLKADYDQVIATLQDKTQMSAPLRYYLGRSLLATGRPEAALRALESMPPDRFEDLTQILAEARNFLSRQQTQAVNQHIETLKGTVRNDRATENDYHELLTLLLAQESWRELERHLKRFLDRYPQSQSAHYGQARLDLANQRYEAAFTGFYNLSNNGYRDGEVFYYGGLAAAKKGDPALANYMFNRAMENDTAFKSEIQAYRNRNRRPPTVQPNPAVTEHIAYLEKVVANANYIEPRIALLRLYYVTAHSEAFQATLSTLLDMDLEPDQQRIVNAWTHVANSRYNKARSELATDTGSEGSFLLGYLQFREQGKPNAKLRSLRLSPNFPEVKLLLSQ